VIGSIRLFNRKMPKAFVKKFDEDWVVFDYKGLYNPYTGYNHTMDPMHCAVVVATMKSREDARTVARARRGEP
jgi:hypothetical protein